MNCVELSFDASIYTADALLATGYWCADTAILHITRQDNLYLITLTAVEGKAFDQAFLDNFNLMAVHNQIRANLKHTFASLETAIVSHAFRPIPQTPSAEE